MSAVQYSEAVDAIIYGHGADGIVTEEDWRMLAFAAMDQSARPQPEHVEGDPRRTDAECRHGVPLEHNCNGCSDEGMDPRALIIADRPSPTPLKPCPFCGCMPEERDGGYVCPNDYCPAACGSLQMATTEAGKRRAWNRRAV